MLYDKVSRLSENMFKRYIKGKRDDEKSSLVEKLEKELVYLGDALWHYGRGMPWNKNYISVKDYNYIMSRIKKIEKMIIIIKYSSYEDILKEDRRIERESRKKRGLR